MHDSDRCLLDDTLVVLFASASLEKDDKQADKLLKLGQGHLATLKSRGRGGDTSLKLGLGGDESMRGYRGATVVVRG